MVGEKEVDPKSADPEFSEPKPGVLRTLWPLKTIPRKLIIERDEKTTRIELQNRDTVRLFPELRAAESASLPYTSISRARVDGQFEGMKYFVGAGRGSSDGSGGGGNLRILPDGYSLVLILAGRECQVNCGVDHPHSPGGSGWAICSSGPDWS